MAGKLEAIICDLDGCLIQTKKFVDIAIDAALARIMTEGIEGFDISRGELMKKYCEVRNQKGSNDTKHFDTTFEILGVPKKQANMLIAYGVNQYQDSRALLQAFPEVPPTLKTVRDKLHYNIYLASFADDSIKQWGKIIRTGLDKFFNYKNSFLTSDSQFQTKCVEFYQTIAKEIGTDPKKCVMVGDSLDTDIRPAKVCGMHTIRVRTGKDNQEKYDNDADYVIPIFSDILQKMHEIEKTL